MKNLLMAVIIGFAGMVLGAEPNSAQLGIMDVYVAVDENDIIL